MRYLITVCALFVLLVISASAADSKPAGDTLVITFKDGRQQSFSVADVARIEFKTSGKETASQPSAGGNFMGRWRVGDGMGNHFIITLDKNGKATKTIGNQRGTWSMVNGEAQINWNDGWHDLIRKVGNKYEKVAFAPGKNFSDSPDNVADAKSLEPI